jgi:hypothetical protein
MTERARWILAAGLSVACVLAWWGLALAGHPEASWLFRDVLGLMG